MKEFVEFFYLQFVPPLPSSSSGYHSSFCVFFLAPVINLLQYNFFFISLKSFNFFARSSSPQTSNSDHGSTPDPQKTPLVIYNLKISSDAKTLAPKNVKRSKKKLPPYCVQYQNSVHKGNVTLHQDPNMKVINDFIVKGTLITNQRRQKTHAAENSPDIIIDCEDNECDECDTTMCESTHNVFNNINTDLLLSMDYYEMDTYGRLPGMFIFI